MYENTDEVYHFSGRKNYLREISEMSDYNHLRVWFLDKITETTTRINKKEETQASSLVERACDYIQEHFSKDISLDGVSKEINISPYYFSKLFKEEKKENFVEYVTRVRIDYTKKMLKNSENSIKEICVSSGYGDPNYFSRIFKKMTGVTPSEYREGGGRISMKGKINLLLLVGMLILTGVRLLHRKREKKQRRDLTKSKSDLPLIQKF